MARDGGGEVGVWRPATDEEGASKIANRSKSAIEQLKLPHEESEVSKYITISLGITTFNEENITTVDEILVSTDKALYAAKASGRNRYVHYNEIK